MNKDVLSFVTSILPEFGMRRDGTQGVKTDATKELREL
jgi:hypothetical protein